MARRLDDALPGGESLLRATVWEFLRPMLSPRLVAFNRNASVSDDVTRARRPAAPHGDSGLDALDLGDDEQPAAA